MEQMGGGCLGEKIKDFLLSNLGTAGQSPHDVSSGFCWPGRGDDPFIPNRRPALRTQGVEFKTCGHGRSYKQILLVASWET